jgi:prepilin-type N-terminal cleavage/methylation domain-containing protein
MICGSPQQLRTRTRHRKHASSRGFTMLELVTVVAIGLVLTAMAIPVVTSSLQYFRFRSAVSSVTSVIQATRYQAIFQGCPYKVAFDASSFNYTISNENPTGGLTTCAATFTAASAIPLTGKAVALSSAVTLQFSPGGAVSNPVTAGAQTLTLTSGNRTATIVVSNFGNVNVTITP